MAQLDMPEAGPRPCAACGDTGSRFPCRVVSYRDQGLTQCSLYPPPGPPARARGGRGRPAPASGVLRHPASASFTTYVDTIKYTTHTYSYTVHAIPGRGSSKLRGRADCPYTVPLYASPGIGVAASASMTARAAASASGASASSAAAAAASSPAATAAATAARARARGTG